MEYEILIDEPLKPIYHFVVEFIFEENKNGRIMHVPVVLVSETGSVHQVIWEKRGENGTCNLPRV